MIAASPASSSPARLSELLQTGSRLMKVTQQHRENKCLPYDAVLGEPGNRGQLLTRCPGEQPPWRAEGALCQPWHPPQEHPASPGSFPKETISCPPSGLRAGDHPHRGLLAHRLQTTCPPPLFNPSSSNAALQPSPEGPTGQPRAGNLGMSPHRSVVHEEHKGSRACTSLPCVSHISFLSFHQQLQTDFLSMRTAMEIERLYSKHFFP